MTCYLDICKEQQKKNTVNEFFNTEGNLYTYYSSIISEINKIFEGSEKNIFLNLFTTIVFANYSKELDSKKVKKDLSYEESKNSDDFDFNKFYSIFDKIKLRQDTYSFFFNEPPCSNNPIKIDIKPLSNRYPHAKISKVYEIELNIKYASLFNVFNPGNQLTTFSDNLIKNGLYDVEVFGSAFNTRLPYYGSMFPELEKTAGCIGTAETIFENIINKKLKVKGILVSPPSSAILHNSACYAIKKIIKLINEGVLEYINIVLAVSHRKIAFIVKNNLHILAKKRVEIKTAYIIRTNKKKYYLEPHKLSSHWFEYYF